VDQDQPDPYAVERLGRRIGALSADEVDRVVEGLLELVG